jgi:hypothetical protein
LLIARILSNFPQKIFQNLEEEHGQSLIPVILVDVSFKALFNGVQLIYNSEVEFPDEEYVDFMKVMELFGISHFRIETVPQEEEQGREAVEVNESHQEIDADESASFSSLNNVASSDKEDSGRAGDRSASNQSPSFDFMQISESVGSSAYFSADVAREDRTYNYGASTSGYVKSFSAGNTMDTSDDSIGSKFSTAVRTSAVGSTPIRASDLASTSTRQDPSKNEQGNSNDTDKDRDIDIVSRYSSGSVAYPNDESMDTSVMFVSEIAIADQNKQLKRKGVCKFCKKEFRMISNARKHEQICCENINRVLFKCRHCNIPYITEKSRNIHEKKCRKKAEKKGSDKENEGEREREEMPMEA